MTEASFKGSWHAALGVFFGATLAYNLMRLVVMRQPRHVVNVCLYATLVCWEMRQARDHWRES